MAEVVFGLGVSHSPMVSTPLSEWSTFVEKDRHLPKFLGGKLLGADGEFYTYEELEEQAGDSMKDLVTPERFEQAYNRCQDAVAASSEALTKAAPDVVIVIGDDQEEIFFDENLPTFAVCRSESMMNISPKVEDVPPNLRHGLWGWYDEKPTEYPGEAGLGLHIIESLIDQGFDPASVQVKSDVSIPHAYGFVQRRLMNGNVRPMVPVFVNCFYEPTQPTTRRCLDFGRALRWAIDSWQTDKTVGIIASGGLSHFVVNEELDRGIVDALRKSDFKALAEIPEKHLRSGNAEAKNWLALGTAVADLQFKEIDYIAAYRSPAGTGCGMAFAEWT